MYRLTTISITTFAIIMGFGLSARAQSTAWSVDKNHTEVAFSVRHLGLSYVRGKFDAFETKIWASPSAGKVTKLEATAQAFSINTGIKKRDDHMRSDDFFNAEKHPTLKVVAQDFKWTGNKFEVVADLTIRNITKKVKFNGELLGTHKVNFGDGDQLRAGYQATATINRHDFGLKFNRIAEGVAVVSDSVTIQIDLQASRPLDET